MLKENSGAGYWIGGNNIIDETLSINPSDYAIRYVRGFSDTSACIILDISSSALKEIMNGLDFGEGSMIGFVTADGRELFLSDDSNVFSSEEFYGEFLGADTSQYINDVIWKGQNYLFIGSKIGDSGAAICTLIPQEIILNQVKDIRNLSVVLGIVACFISVLIGVSMASGIRKAIRYIIRELRLVSEGDLTTRIKLKRKDEFLILSGGINDMIEKTGGLISQVKTQGDSVTESSMQVRESSEAFSQATREITDAINEIQKGVSQQAQDAEHCLSQMDDLSEKIELVNEKQMK